MPIGPGKYDTLCTDARIASNAKAALLIIIGGDLGSSFCVQSDRGVISPKKLASILRYIADGIENDSEVHRE
jgi:hypothetical protein